MGSLNGLKNNFGIRHPYFYRWRFLVRRIIFVAESARENIRQRQRGGIEAAKLKGLKFGRSRKELPPEFESAYHGWNMGALSAGEAAKLCGMPKSNFCCRARERKKKK